MTLDLFSDDPTPHLPGIDTLAPGAKVLRSLAADQAVPLLAAIAAITTQAPFRHMTTPGGQQMSVGLTNCGALGWVTDRSGYRYTTTDPSNDRPWPAMPEVMSQFATRAAAAAGFDDFAPDACLINRYLPGTRMSLHQDKDERDNAHPIVSVSLGVSAVFLFGGLSRREPAQRIPLRHGDVVVWGGPSRLRYHGIQPIKLSHHSLTGKIRFNLTFRKAG